MHLEHEARRVEHDLEFTQVELTYALGHVFWNQGCATEAGRAMIEHGFRELNIGRIVNSVAAENVRSANLMKTLGLRIERNLRPDPFSGPRVDSPGVIGVLDSPRWRR